MYPILRRTEELQYYYVTKVEYVDWNRKETLWSNFHPSKIFIRSEGLPSNLHRGSMVK